MRNDEVKRLIKSQEPTFLQTARHKGYVCPVCGNGRGRDGDGIMRKPGSDFYHCFKCGFHDDVFGLIGEFFSLPDFKEQLAKAEEIYGAKGGEITPPKAPKAAPEPEKEVLEDQTAKFRAWSKALNEPGNPGLAYMQARGLSLETLNLFSVGYASTWKHPKTENLSKVPTSPRVIIPTSPYSYLARDIRNPESLKDSEKRYTKSKVGRVRLFNAGALKDAKETVFVVEGEIDAMSIAEAGGLAVGLGSASNVRVLVEEVKKHKPAMGIVILPDNDEAGKSSAAKLVKELKDAGADSVIANIFGSYKDANEMLVKNREKLEAQIADLKQAFTPEVKNTADETDACNRALLTLLNLHDRHKEFLIGKGLTEEQIERYCYRSAPSDPKAVCKQLKRMGFSFENNPLFGKDSDDEWTILSPTSGLFIPERNSRGKIQGFERLGDQKGETTYPLAHVHFRRGARGITEVVVTGMALRADIICALSGYSVLAVPESVSDRVLKSAFESLKKRGLKKVRLAYNMSQSRQARTDRTKEALKELGISHSTLDWDPKYTGLNDYLLYMKQQKEDNHEH